MDWFRPGLYRWTRDLHLYVGLFISPFILLFSISVFFLNHAKVDVSAMDTIERFQPIAIPSGLDTAHGRNAVTLARQLFAPLHLSGEVGFTLYITATRHFTFPVSKPGLEATVDVDLDGRSATVTKRRTGVLEALAYLHKMPGPHNAALRGNWIATELWRWWADGTVYLTFFLSVTGLYLWYALRVERTIGLVLLGSGALTLMGIMYAVVR